MGQKILTRKRQEMIDEVKWQRHNISWCATKLSGTERSKKLMPDYMAACKYGIWRAHVLLLNQRVSQIKRPGYDRKFPRLARWHQSVLYSGKLQNYDGDLRYILR